MRKYIGAILSIFLTVTSYVTLAQKISTEVGEKEGRAAKVADRFVERFRQTLDFGIAWKAFRLSDPSCTHRANGNLGENDYDKLKLSRRTIEKLYIATMNYYYLKAIRDLSLGPIDSKFGSEESLVPRDIQALEKGSKFFQNNDHEPQTAEEVRELIDTFDQLAAQYRKHMPIGRMKSAAWRANQKYLMARSGMAHSDTLNGNATFCVPEESKVYIVDRGLFYFYIVEEGGTMKVAGLGID